MLNDAFLLDEKERQMMPADGGPAFPRRLPNIEVPPDRAIEIIRQYAGMSLRDYFAGQALSAMMNGQLYATSGHDEVAAGAYAVADAMLKARESHASE